MLSIVNTIKDNKFLISTWAKYNLQANYIDTKLGVFWIILQPIFQTLIYTLVFGTLLGRNPRGDVPFILFFLAGTSVWQFMNNNWMQASNIVVKNINLMSQVKISAEAVVIVQLVESLVDFIINFVILVIFSLLFGYFPTYYYLYLPLIFAIIIVTTLGGMFFISSLGVFIRDIPTLLSMVLRLLFFVSGVIITPDMLPENIQGFLWLNPLLQMIEAVRNLVIYAKAPTFQSVLYMASFSILVFWGGYSHFKKRQGVFVDYQ
jgi:lipopolysaccharide transport system permease protein